MKHFLANILPRLKKVSASLDQSALLVDKPWVVSPVEDASQEPTQKLIFREDGRLHVSVEGEIHDGSWEYLPGANAVLIEQRGQKRLYKHAYLDKAVLALVKDTTTQHDEYYLLADENLVPDGDVVRYLTEKFNLQNKLDEHGLGKIPLPFDDDSGKQSKSSLRSNADKNSDFEVFVYPFVAIFVFFLMFLIIYA